MLVFKFMEACFLNRVTFTIFLSMQNLSLLRINQSFCRYLCVSSKNEEFEAIFTKNVAGKTQDIQCGPSMRFQGASNSLIISLSRTSLTVHTVHTVWTVTIAPNRVDNLDGPQGNISIKDSIKNHRRQFQEFHHLFQHQIGILLYFRLSDFFYALVLLVFLVLLILQILQNLLILLILLILLVLMKVGLMEQLVFWVV